MNCPRCNHDNAPGALRCPNCGGSLTLWLIYVGYAQKAHRAGLHALETGVPAAAAEHFLRATIFAPDTPAHLEALGRVLAQLGRYTEAVTALDRADQLAPSEATKQARAKAEALSRPAPVEAPPLEAQAEAAETTDHPGPSEDGQARPADDTQPPPEAVAAEAPAPDGPAETTPA